MHEKKTKTIEPIHKLVCQLGPTKKSWIKTYNWVMQSLKNSTTKQKNCQPTLFFATKELEINFVWPYVYFNETAENVLVWKFGSKQLGC